MRPAFPSSVPSNQPGSFDFFTAIKNGKLIIKSFFLGKQYTEAYT